MEISTIELKNVMTENAPPDSRKQPPPYDSPFGKIKNTNESSDGFFNCLVCASATCCCVLVLVALALLGVSIASIVIGESYLDDCPLEKNIPIYLIVSGSVSLFISCCFYPQRSEEEEKSIISGSCICRAIFGQFLSAWLIAGSVWVYSSYDDLSTNSASANYCHPTLYYFAFWKIIAEYTVIGLVSLIYFCCHVAVHVCGKNEQDIV